MATKKRMAMLNAIFVFRPRISTIILNDLLFKLVTPESELDNLEFSNLPEKKFEGQP
jgi:hypothetical protein